MSEKKIIEGSALEDLLKVATDVKVAANALQQAVAGLHNFASRSGDARLMKVAEELTAAVYPDSIEAEQNPDTGRRTVKKFVTGDGLLFDKLIDRLIQFRVRD